jgi:hypothetical protein
MENICRFISKPGPDDVRWEKVEKIRQIVTGGTFPAPPEQVAARLIDEMLERGRADPSWSYSKSWGKPIDSSGVGPAPIAGKARRNDVKRIDEG